MCIYMSFNFRKMVTFKMQKLVAVKAFKMEMAMAGAVAYILIAGAVPLFKNIFSYCAVTAELF